MTGLAGQSYGRAQEISEIFRGERMKEQLETHKSRISSDANYSWITDFPTRQDTVFQVIEKWMTFSFVYLHGFKRGHTSEGFHKMTFVQAIL